MKTSKKLLIVSGLHRIFISSLGALALLLPSMGQAQETWTFDPTFQRTPLRQTSEFASGVKFLSSGKVLIHTVNGSHGPSGANGERIGALLRIEPDTGAIDPTWNPDLMVTGRGFLGVAEAPDGKVYYATSLIGEVLTNLTDPAVHRLIRLNTNGTRDTSFNSPIFAMAARFLGVQPDGKIIVCSGGVNLNGIPPAGSIVQTVRLNTDGTLDTTFQSPNFQRSATSPPADVASGNYFDAGVMGNPVIDSTTGKIYFCGPFNFVNGQARKGIVRCNADGTLDPSFVPTGLFVGSGGSTIMGGRAMVLQTGGKVVLGGTNLRTAAGGSSTHYTLLRFNTDGALDSTFTLVPTTNSLSGPRDIHALPGGNILTAYTRVLRFLPDGAVDSSFTPLDYSSPHSVPFPNSVFAFRFDVNPNTGAAYLANAGPFYARLGGVPVSNITKLTPAGTIDTQFNSPVVDSEDFAPDVQISGGAVYVSGRYTDFRNAANSTITRLLADGTRDPSYSLDTLPFADKQAFDLAFLPDGAAYVIYRSGSFNGGYLFSNLARLLPTGALDTSFRPSSALQTSLGVNAFDGNDVFNKILAPSISAAPNGGAYAFPSGGAQETVNANGNLKPTRINTDGTEDTSVPALGFPVGEVIRDSSQITGGSTGYLHRLAQTADGGFIILASVAPFPASTGAPFNYNYRVIKLQADGSRDTSFESPSLTSTAEASQNFPTVFDPVTGNTAQPPNGFYIAGDDPPVSSAAMLPDGSVLLAGRFQLTGDPTTYSLAKLTPAGALDTSFTPPVPENTARANRPAVISNVRVAPDGRVWVLGRFDTIGGISVPGVAGLNPDGTVDSAFSLTEVGFYDSFDEVADVVFANSNTAYLIGTFRRPGEPLPFAVTRIVRPAGLVANVSTRLPVGTDENVLIEGFIVQGPAGSTKKIIVRALGPFLTQFGITDALANPTLEIHDASNATVATNNDWKTTQVGGLITGDQFAEISASQLAPGNDLESAIIADLAPGNYTAVARGSGNTTGSGIVDAYDLSPASPARLANIATRGLIQPGDKLMIAGFIIQNGPVRAVIRAVGPSLIGLGIANALPDTTLQLRDQNGAIVLENDDWKTDQKQELEDIGLQPTHDLEAALITTIQPGQYTAQVRGKGQASGIGVVEVYFPQ